MGAPSQYWVDPSLNSNTGGGTEVDPWGDLEYALTQITHNSADGEQINIKSGVEESLSGQLSISWSPSLNHPTIFRGFTTIANDGGMATVELNGYRFVSGKAGIHIVDLELKNDIPGGDHLLSFDSHCRAINCKLHGSSGGRAISPTNSGRTNVQVCGCEVYDIGGQHAIWVPNQSVAWHNWVNCQVGPNRPTNAGIKSEAGCYVGRNMITMSAATAQLGIDLTGSYCVCEGNSILCEVTGGGKGIEWDNDDCSVLSNLVEGLSGGGGIGIHGVSGDEAGLIGMNSVFNCTSPYTIRDPKTNLGNETLAASPFAKAGANTFANRFEYFAAVDTGEVHGGAYVGP